MQFLTLYSYIPLCDDRVAVAATRLAFSTLKLIAPWKCVRAFASTNEKTFSYLLENSEAWGRQWLRNRTPEKSPTEKLLQHKDRATTLYEYEAATTALDKLQGHDDWKETRESIEPSYRPEVIEFAIERLRNAIEANDTERLADALRLCSTRSLGGMDNIRLYKHSWFGTKNLIDSFNNTVVEAIDALVESAFLPETSLVDVRLLQMALSEAATVHGRTALSLSGGALLGMKHIGVCKTLWECDLLPEVISGTSAGSIVAAIVATQTDKQMEETLRHFPNSNLGVFDDRYAKPGMIKWLWYRVTTMLRRGTWFDPRYLQAIMREWLGDLTFLESYNKTHRILNITVSKASSAEPTLLNYKKSPNVLIWSAVCASCAVPLKVYPEATVWEKVPGTRKVRAWLEHARAEKPFMYVDGSLDHDIPLAQLRELFNVNWSIVSQTNPHVRPFLPCEEEFTGVQPKGPRPVIDHRGKTAAHPGLVWFAQAMSRLKLPAGLLRWEAILNQQYTGDVDIFPEYSWYEVARMVANPSAEYMQQATIDGERATWPKICRIKNAVKIELAIERGLRALAQRIHFPDKKLELTSDHRGRATFRGSSTEPKFLRSSSVGFEVRESKKLLRRRRASCDGRMEGSQKKQPHELPDSRTLSRSHTIPVLVPRSGVNEWTLMMTPIQQDEPDSVDGLSPSAG